MCCIHNLGERLGDVIALKIFYLSNQWVVGHACIFLYFLLIVVSKRSQRNFILLTPFIKLAIIWKAVWKEVVIESR